MNRFKSMFDVVSKENADATTIPVVLELDVQPAESSANVAADPATEAPVEPAAATEPAAVEGEDLGQAEGDEEGETTAVELAEAEAEHSELMNEIEVVEDVAEKVESDAADVKEALDANDQAVAEGKEEVITPANVAIATQAFELRLERLGLSLTDLCPSANISRETFISKEEGGLGMKPSEVLRNLHNEISREDGVLDKIKAGAKRVWDAIIEALKKVIGLVEKILPTQKNRLIKMNKLVEGAKIESAEINIGQVTPAIAFAKDKVKFELPQILESLDASVKANNEIIKLVNSANSENGDLALKLNGVVLNIFGVFPKLDGDMVVAIHRTKIWLINMGKGLNPVISKDIEKFDKKEQFTKSVLTDLISKEVDVLPKVSSRVAEYKKIVANLEKLNKVEDSKLKAAIANAQLRSFYNTLYRTVIKSYSEYAEATIAVAKEFMKADKEANK